MLYYNKFISLYSQMVNCQTYLELGLYDGENINLVAKHVPDCVGVDINGSKVINNFGTFHCMSTHEFFKQNTKLYDIIFIDADHMFNSVITDFENSLTILKPNGTIFLHDTDPSEKKFIAPGYCGTAYQIVDCIHNSYSELDILTIPADTMGLSMVRRIKDRRIK